MEPLPIPLPRNLTVLAAPIPAGEPVSQLLAELALHGPLTVLDGGNCFPAFRLLRHLHFRTPDSEAASARILVRRAFTCYQMLALLEGTPELPQPCIVLVLLATFYDEQIVEREIQRLLANCLRELERLARLAPLLVTLSPPRAQTRAALVEQVCARADRLYLPELPSPATVQPALF